MIIVLKKKKEQHRESTIQRELIDENATTDSRRGSVRDDQMHCSTWVRDIQSTATGTIKNTYIPTHPHTHTLDCCCTSSLCHTNQFKFSLIGLQHWCINYLLLHWQATTTPFFIRPGCRPWLSTKNDRTPKRQTRPAAKKPKHQNRKKKTSFSSGHPTNKTTCPNSQPNVIFAAAYAARETKKGTNNTFMSISISFYAKPGRAEWNRAKLTFFIHSKTCVSSPWLPEILPVIHPHHQKTQNTTRGKTKVQNKRVRVASEISLPI